MEVKDSTDQMNALTQTTTDLTKERARLLQALTDLRAENEQTIQRQSEAWKAER
jgi:hypothetical protein